MKKVNQKDIAKSLNISRVTVTKALNDDPGIAKKTRILVKSKALEIGYIPDYIGRSLSKKKTFTIGVVIPKIAHSFFSYSIENFYKAAIPKGYNIILMVSFEDPEIEKENIRQLLSMRVDGLIIDIAGNDIGLDNYEIAKRSGSKILFYDRCPVNCKDGAIITNDREGAYKATSLLIKKGYKNICHLAGPGFLNISADRLKGYEDALADHNLSANIVNVELTKEGGYLATIELIKNNLVPEAIFAVNDSVAHGVYNAVKEQGLKIPEDIAIIGFGDIENSKLLVPSLSSVKIPVKEMTQSAIDTMVDMIENDKKFTGKIVYSAVVIERDSV